MALNFNPYPRPQQPTFKEQVLDPVNQGFNTLIQAQQQKKLQERQAMLDKYMQEDNARKQFEFNRQNTPTPDAPFTPYEGGAQPGPYAPQPLFGQAVKNGVDTVAMWKAQNGVPPGMSRADYTDSMGYQKTQSDLEEQQAKIRLQNAQADFYGRRPGEASGSTGSYQMAGIGADGQPIFYNNKSLEVRTAPVPGGGTIYPKTPSEGQMNSSLFGQRASDSNQQIEQLINSGFDPTSLTSGAQAKFPNIMQPENIQAYEQAKRNFRNAVLRKESGAAISPSEHAEAEKQYFPVAGDSPEVLKFKARNRQTAIEGLNRMAGPLATRNKSQPLTKTQKNKITGQTRTVTSYDGGQTWQ